MKPTFAEAGAAHPIAEALRKQNQPTQSSAEAENCGRGSSAEDRASRIRRELYIEVFATAQVLYRMLINVGYKV